ncbi:SNF1-interacting protein [Cyanidiococcus yangmingshanensis]|uniref:SNF1-interacting protein n=1 Tax=Cyanidiococcus yangmingshanensis TaxID=2690220 RepID=A0A7J7ILF8_9RHOD|nr:SNF1-interacting protein [Cyanidiococcus yangmingshanensis]
MRIEKCISTLKAVVAAATRERVALWLGFGGETRAKENVLRGDSDWRASLAEPTDDLHELMNISLARRKAYLSIRRSRSSPTLRMTTDTLHVSETCGLHILHDDHHPWNSDKSALDTHRDTVAIEEEPSRAKMYQSAEFGGHQEAPRDLRKAEFDRQPPAQDLTNAAGECEAVTPLEENLIDFESSFAPSSLSSGSWLRVPDDPQRILCDRDPLSPKRRRSARRASVTFKCRASSNRELYASGNSCNSKRRNESSQ